MKNKTTQISQNSMYYVGLAIQRLSLLLACASTILLWIIMSTISHSFATTGSLKNVDFIDPNELNRGISNEISQFRIYAIVLSLVAISLSLLLYKLPQIRKYRKHIIFDSLIIGVFCLVLSVWSETIYRIVLSTVI